MAFHSHEREHTNYKFHKVV